jgi:hypothetical protein
MPLRDASVDVVVSNCVVNLSADKPAVPLTETGLAAVRIERTHDAGAGVHAATIQATKPR